ncbi:hypothetical protein F2P79_000176 [Pimephales promelas]|nr:hypothetical protein F2P79_000176 [Pimephales promelas]
MSSLLLTHFAAGIRSGGFQYNFFQKCCSEVNPVHNPCSKTGSFPTAKSTATDSELHTPQRLFSEPRPILHSVFAFVHVLAASAHTTAGTTGLHILIHTPLQLGSPSPPPSPASDTLNRALHQTPYTHPTSSYSKVTPPDNNDGLCALQPFLGILQRTNNGAVLRNPTQQNSTEADVEMTARNWLRLRRDRKQEGEHLKVK